MISPAQIWSLLLANFAVVQSILVKLGLVASQATANQIFTVVDDSSVVVLDIRAQEDNLQASIDAFRAETLSNSLAIITAISNLPQTGDPVVLPTTPPGGYGGLPGGDIFNAVWNGLNAPDLYTPYQYVKDAGMRAEFLSGYATLAPADGNFSYYGQLYDEFGNPPGFYPVFDLALLDPSDTLLTFMITCNPGATVFWSPADGLQVAVNGDNGDGTAKFLTTWNEASFQALKQTVFPSSTFAGLSLWPGLSGVTFGSTVALASAVDLDEPMNGILIHLDTVPPDKARYIIGSLTATAHIGQIAFSAGITGMEYPQNLSFPDEIYVPTTMILALGVKIRCVPGVTGTVTAWTKTV